MRLKFNVVDKEMHAVEFSFSKIWGGLTISVDGKRIVTTIRTVSFELVKTYEFVVGTDEKHTVRIEKRRELLFAPFRPQPVTAFVDGARVAEGVA
jgi:hypothetical protein